MQHELDEALEEFSRALLAYDAASAALDDVTGIGANPITVIYPLVRERDRCRERMDDWFERLRTIIRKQRH